ncbi:hypothetical protein [Pseudanabaena sp. FACHB-2040]|uniref:hypothetical protein n=1 Tax=Pseudanabaena sp. FACHB-2040 TaxID=2692859 RepID=UPI001688936D|nr:hypothetical protein [Pseudanabaena sp. FACHB-2040]MBD2259126.1 hypothetical protein [Pseudanabaena sp. FACHB-2040]
MNQLALGLMVATLFLVSGCRGQQTSSPEPSLAAAPESAVSPVPDPVVETAPPQPEVPVAAPDTVATNTSQLPVTLVQQWDPLSNVLFEFGPMTVGPDQITWSSGQTSDYSVVGTDNGYLLRLDPVPVFFDTANPYIKLIPQTNPAGAVTEVEVAFYENEQKAQSDEYIMFGTYMVR